MLEITFLLLFIAGLIGMGVIIKRKIPVLLALSPQEAYLARTKKRTYSKGLFLQKILSKVRILVLKTDNKTNEWMKRLRQKSQENKEKFSDSYWDKLRK